MVSRTSILVGTVDTLCHCYGKFGFTQLNSILAVFLCDL